MSSGRIVVRRGYHRRMDDRVDGDRHGRGTGRVYRPVVCLVGEAVGADIIGYWRIGKRTAGVECQRAMAWVARQNCRQAIAVRVRVIGKHARRRDSQCCVLVHRIAVGIRHRGVVGRRTNIKTEDVQDFFVHGREVLDRVVAVNLIEGVVGALHARIEEVARI